MDNSRETFIRASTPQALTQHQNADVLCEGLCMHFVQCFHQEFRLVKAVRYPPIGHERRISNVSSLVVFESFNSRRVHCTLP